jgi:hypothetical protein
MRVAHNRGLASLFQFSGLGRSSPHPEAVAAARYANSTPVQFQDAGRRASAVR